MLRLGVEKNYVDISSEPSRVTMCTGPLPDYFVSEILGTKHQITYRLQIMTHRRVAVEIKTPRRFQHSVKLDKSERHHREIGESVRRDFLVREEQVIQVLCLHRVQLGKRILYVLQRPCILERNPLRLYLLIIEEDIVIPLAIERRVNVDEVNAVRAHFNCALQSL